MINRNLMLIIFIIIICSCKKITKENTPVPPPTVEPGADSIPKDPETSASIGFFMNNWVAKTFDVPSSATDKTIALEPSDVTIDVNTGEVITKITPTYFGNNTNPFITQIGNNATVISNLQNFKPGLIRAPGGSLSDVYFFNAPKNTPPSDVPDTLVDASSHKFKNYYWFGRNTESWTQSIDNYYTLLQSTNSKGVITINYGYARYGTSLDPVAAAAHLAAEWVRYDNKRTQYFEIGNENNGSWEAGYRIDVSKNKDGQPEYISGSLYGKHFKIFADSMRKAANEIGATIFIGAQLIEKPNSSNAIDQNWNNGYFTQAGNAADFYIVHDYFTPYNQNSTASQILNTGSSEPNKVMDWMKNTTTSANVPMKPIAMTEWNIFATGSKQMVSHVAGIHAILTLSELIGKKFGASLRWDLANGWSNGDDMGLFSLGDEPGVSKWSPRPVFYYMYYFQKLMGDRMISSVSDNTDIVSFASTFSSGQKSVTLINKGIGKRVASIKFKYFTPGNKFYYYILTGGTDNGEFSRQVFINEIGPDNSGTAGGFSNYNSIKIFSTTTLNGIKVVLPPRSVVFMVVDKR